MTRYATSTNVDSARSKAEIENIVTKYGATSFVSGWQGDRATIMFEMTDRRVRFTLPLPSKDDREFTHTGSRGTRRKPDTALKAWEQSCRSKWRALALVVKAKLEAVESGITTFDEEFLAHILVPGGGGKTVGQLIANSNTLSAGTLPPLLGSGK